jgi:DHA3 family macrolide efflux protein-like MFS transporter
MNLIRLNGFRLFGFIWFGQLISIIGSGLTGFALGVWVYQETGSVTEFSFILLSSTLPGMLISPIAGVLVDRFDRRWIMMISDLVAGMSTLTIFFLLYTQHLALWHILITNAVGAIGNAFQFPAYQATVSLLVPKEHLGRANGMIQFAEAASMVTAPLLAGYLIKTIDVHGVVLIDFVTCLFAVASLLIVRFPRHTTQSGNIVEKKKGAFFENVTFGWRYIWGRPGLRGLLFYFAISNFLFGFMNVTLTPLVLSFSDEKALGLINSVSGIGMILGGLLMSIWGGAKRKINSLVFAGTMGGVALILQGVQASVITIAIAMFLQLFVLPIANGSSQSIWQSKVAPEVQGRVFSVRRLIAISLNPLAYLLSGPTVDYIFEPLMAKKGPLSGTIGAMIGTGTGRGIGLMLILLGILLILNNLVIYLNPRVRNVEDEIPDAIVKKEAVEL